MWADWFAFKSIGSNNEGATLVPTSLLLFDCFSPHCVHPLPLSVPSLFFRVSYWNKQLLSTFRPVKWEKAVAVQLSPSLTGFSEDFHCENLRVEWRIAISSLPWHFADGDENKTRRTYRNFILNVITFVTSSTVVLYFHRFQHFI